MEIKLRGDKKSSEKKVEKLETTNQKIIDFYSKTGLDFDSMNLLIIDMYEKMSNELSGTIDKNMKTDILANIKSEKHNNEIFRKEILSTLNNSVEIYKNEISTIKNFNSILTNEVIGLREIIMKLNNDLTNSIIAKLFEIKQSYVDEIKNIISSKESANIIKLMELVEKENNILVDKTLKTINEIIPKTNAQNANYIESLINNFKLEIGSNINTIKNGENTLNIDDVSKLFDNKYNALLTNIQQTMLMNLNSSEERINKNILDLKDFELIKQNNQEKINEDLTTYLNKFKNSTIKGQQGETKLINVLQEIYTTAEVIDTSNESKKCDILLKRNNKPVILIENKTYQNPVSKDELTKFCRDIEYQNQCGIMFSQTSNISTKENYQIDIINNNVIIYVSNCNYDQDKIKMAICMIDHLYPKINDSTNKNVTIINDDIMVLINEEYKKFLNQRDAIKNYINDTNKKLISQLYEMELPNLNNILLTKFTIVQDVNLTCNICRKFVGLNKKSLSKHMQSCKKKENQVTNSSDNLNETIEEFGNDEENSFDEIIDSLKNSDEKTKENILEQIEEFKRSTTEEQVDEKPKKLKKSYKTKSKETEV